MNRLNALGLGLIVVGAILAPFCYLVIYSIPLIGLGITAAIIGIVVLLLPPGRVGFMSILPPL